MRAISHLAWLQIPWDEYTTTEKNTFDKSETYNQVALTRH